MTDAKLETTRVDSIPRQTEGRTLYVLPTIPDMVSMASGWRASSEVIAVIAPLLTGCLNAMQFLTLLNDGSLDNRAVCISFSDQLTSAIEAPIPVEFDGTKTYFPSIEIIANGAHFFTLYVWTGDMFRRIDPLADPYNVLLAIRRYFRSCEALGDAWLVRATQFERSPLLRADQARLRLRTLLSAIMHASSNALSPTHHSIAAKLLAMERNL